MGCGAVLVLIVLWPLVLIGGILALVTSAATTFVTSAAFPLLIISFVFSMLAATDVIILLWRWYQQRETFVFDNQMLVRPLILAGIAFAFFVATCVISGSLIVGWLDSL